MRSLPRFASLFVFVVVVFVNAPKPANATIHTGIGRLEYWDFSDSATVLTDEWDLSLLVVMQLTDKTASSGIYWIRAGYPSNVALLPTDSTYDVLTQAPADPSVYHLELEFIPYRTWVCRTQEGNYAKLRFLGDSIVEFEYTYQDNGTRYFRDGVPVAERTWGKIKELFAP